MGQNIYNFKITKTKETPSPLPLPSGERIKVRGNLYLN